MKLIKISEAADRLGVSRQTMINWGKSGVIKLRKMGKSGNGFWVDADTIDALSDTIADVEHTKQMLAKEQEETRKLYERECEIRSDLERELFHLGKDNGWYTTKEFYRSIPVMLQELGVLTERDAIIMQRMIDGDDIGRIGEDFGLTRLRLIQIFSIGCSRVRSLTHLKERLDQADRERTELEYLRKKVRTDADHIREMEEKLEIKSKPQNEEQDRELLMKRLVDCDFSVRVLNCLKAADLETVGDLVQVRRSELLQFRNFGLASLTELDNFLETIGMEWGTKFLVPVYHIYEDGSRGWIKGYKFSDTPAK